MLAGDVARLGAHDWPALAAHRQAAAVVRSTWAGGVRVWVVLRHREAREALKDPRLSKDATLLHQVMSAQLAASGLIDATADTTPDPLLGNNMAFSDGEAHQRLRSVVAEHVTTGRVADLRAGIDRISASLVAQLPRDTAVDLIDSFAFPLPIGVMSELLGVPGEDRWQLREWTAGLIADDQAVAGRASAAMRAYVDDLLASKRKRPDTDLLSYLVQGQLDGRLNAEELVATVFLLVVAGHETTTNLIANAARWLLDDPSAWAAIHRDPSSIPTVIEEVLRFDPPVGLTTHRVTTEPVVYGGVEIDAGEVVLISIASANRDEAVFSQPHRLNLSAPGRGHLAFGHGLHYCPGARLARLETEIALRDLTAAFPTARLAVPPEQLERATHSAINSGYVRLPVILTSARPADVSPWPPPSPPS
ncbi:cytochrome P450 family protein [Kutzneria sp. CA-103260]|uniref:cytochrome P450 family protein n=1 Tax=Kutzneria sp. CA-103260 TaxID=2802641 RepID=UPI001BADB76C|nr:cytochrome P450 [Kutzneria sp. CA-103260]QUQ72480.1 cytochrome P450 [Kutzneria sp. CA-103260]